MCISYEVLRREAANNLDPTDPDYELYVKINEVNLLIIQLQGDQCYMHVTYSVYTEKLPIIMNKKLL